MRISLRLQIVAMVGALLLAAMGFYVWLANRVVTGDKTASVYDVNALVAGTVATQVDDAVGGIADKLRYFGQEFEATPGDAENRARSLFAADDQVLSLEVHKRTGDGFERAYLYVDSRRLASMNISPDDLTQARLKTPVPLAGLAGTGLVLQNASLAPDLALMRVSTATADGRAVVTADLRPEWLLRTVATSKLYRVYLVDGTGLVLADPDAAKVINHLDVSENDVVRKALHEKLARGAAEYDAAGTVKLAAWARLTRTPGAVVVEVPRDEVFRATRELSERSVLFAGGVVLAALVVGILLSQRVTAPLRQLQRTMAIVSQGEYGVEAPIDGPTEIREVGGAFNSLSRELVRRSDELQRTHSQLVQSEKLSAVGELSASVAHEVKNPMVGIVGFAQLGLQSTSADEMREFFQLIEQDAMRANQILVSLLEFARPPEVKMEPLDVNEVVGTAMALCRHRLRLDGVAVDVRLGQGLAPFKGNSNQLRQVLLNLALNAGQAMDASPKKEVTVSTTRGADGWSLITVADTGPGMSEEVRSNLFKPFFTTKLRNKGTGLGLSVSKSIIEAHRGTIEVRSAEGQGATFSIRLPPAV
jgi:signal transduction histidine kinase